MSSEKYKKEAKFVTRLLWVVTILYLTTLIVAPDELIQSQYFVLIPYFLFGFSFFSWVLADGRARYGEEKAFYYLYAIISPMLWFMSAPAYVLHSNGVREGGKIILTNIAKLIFTFILVLAFFAVGKVIATYAI